VIAFQKSEGLTPDGIVGPQTLDRLGMPAAPPPAPAADVTAKVTATQVSRMFPPNPHRQHQYEPAVRSAGDA